MPNDSKTYILDDQWTDIDALDFTPYVETLADIIQTGNTPLTIGVFGTWGSGKTSLMRMVKKQLPNDFTIAWFDAWKYDKEETLWRAFILSVLSAVRSRVKEGQPTQDLDYLETMLYRAIEIEKTGGVTIDLAKLGGSVTKGVVQLGLSFIPGGTVLSEFVKKVQELGAESLTDEMTDAIQRERTKIHIEQVRFLEQFQNKFRILVEQHISNNGGRLVVFVDDLDRCLPEKAVEVLEAIKLFLDAENCVFMLGLDQEVIARGIEMKYKELGVKQDGDSQQHFTVEGVRYLEKIIQLPFQIPPVEQNDMGDFVQKLSAEWPHEECPKIFAEGLGNNPRQIKRTVNVFLLLWNLAEKRKYKLQGRIKPIRLAKVVTIQAIYPELYNLLKDEPRYLGELEKFHRGGSIISPTQEGMEKVSREVTQAKDELPPALVPYISRHSIRRVLTLHAPEAADSNFIGLKPDELKLYFTLTRRAETHKVARFNSAMDLLGIEPQMVRIPAGKFVMGTTVLQAQAIKKAINNEENKQDWFELESEQPQHTVELSEYFIGKYPVTNREYQVFVKSEKYIPPSNWDGIQFPVDKGGHPVTSISWSDATNYCLWLSKISGKQFRLPTEAEWEKAARGENGFIYPWGNEFDSQNANTNKSKVSDTSEVGQYSPQGDSPYDCADMVGNVWEWCKDFLDDNEYKNRLEGTIKDPQGPTDGYYHVLRGGCFFDSPLYTRCAIRGFSQPLYSPNYYGFRVAFSHSLLSSRETEILLLSEKG